MKRSKAKFSIKLLCILLIPTLQLGCYYSIAEKTGKEGMVIPSFKLLLVDSINYFDTRDIAKGKPFVIFYYRSNCPYSRALMDEIIKNMASFKNYQFIIATRSPFNQMKSFYTHFKLNKYKNFIAGLDIENVVPEYYNVKGVPFTAIFDNDKKLVCSFTGRIDGKVILNSINPYK